MCNGKKPVAACTHNKKDMKPSQKKMEEPKYGISWFASATALIKRKLRVVATTKLRKWADNDPSLSS